MICLTVLYRNSPGSNFDFDYYVNTHLPMAKERLIDFGWKSFEVRKGIGSLNGEDPTYICVVHTEFSNLEDMKQGLDTHAQELMADVPNYTNIEPEIQISELVSAN